MPWRWTPLPRDFVAFFTNIRPIRGLEFGYVQEYSNKDGDVFIVCIEAYGVLKAEQCDDQMWNRSDLRVQPARLMRAVWTVLGPVVVLAARSTGIPKLHPLFARADKV